MTTTKKLKNKVVYSGKLLPMGNETYRLRSKVMKVLYQVKEKGYHIPRIEIRIVSHDTNACAYAYLGKNIIHVNEKYVSSKYEDLFIQIILHEIVHATFGIGEVQDCKLMHCSRFWVNRPDTETAWKLFDKYYQDWL